MRQCTSVQGFKTRRRNLSSGFCHISAWKLSQSHDEFKSQVNENARFKWNYCMTHRTMALRICCFVSNPNDGWRLPVARPAASSALPALPPAVGHYRASVGGRRNVRRHADDQTPIVRLPHGIRIEDAWLEVTQTGQRNPLFLQSMVHVSFRFPMKKTWK